MKSDEVIYDYPENPRPENFIAGYFKSRDNKNLRYAIFRNTNGLTKGTIVLLHGRNETIEKHYETIRNLNDAGMWVATFDWRGQGGSERLLKNPLRGYVKRFRHYENDLEDFLEKIVLPDARLPFFLIAHSTGGLVALAAAPRLHNRIEKMVLAAPFVGFSGEDLNSGFLKLVTGFLSVTGFGWVKFGGSNKARPFAENVLTSDPQRYARNVQIYEKFPKLALGAPSARWLYECAKAMKRVWRREHLDSIRVPTLILIAGNDRIISRQLSEDFGMIFRASNEITIDGAKHELFSEIDFYRDQALAAVTSFIPGGVNPESKD